MPELPEVETIRRDLEHGILRKTIQHLKVLDKRVLRQGPRQFQAGLQGCTIESVSRRGKALVLQLSSGQFWIVQVMMTGQMVINGKPDKHTRLELHFSDGSTLLYNDQRVFGQLRVVKDLSDVGYFRHLGPEPFADDFSEQYIASYLKKTKRPIKNVLLDHRFVAGVGNIYASEILFRCSISPTRLGSRIRIKEVPMLRQETKTVLQEAINQRGSSMRNYRDGAGEKGTFNKSIRVYARAAAPCLNCGNPISRIVQSGRSSFYCRKCQR